MDTRKYRKAYRERNKERRRIYFKKWKAKNLSSFLRYKREYNREWRAKHPQLAKKLSKRYSARYRERHPEELKKYKREWMRQWRKNNPELSAIQSRRHVALYMKRHPERVRKMVALSVKKWRAKFPERNKAHRIVFTARRNGTILQEKCFCGDPETHAHHSDYSKPLEIKWLCRRHHVIADKQRRARLK